MPQDFQDIQTPQTEYVCMLDESQTRDTSTESFSLEDALAEKAQEISDLYSDGIQWSDIGSMLSLGLDFLKTFQHVSLAEKKTMLVTILYDVIDQTDTPFLPDSYTDPLFKAMIPPLIEIVLNAQAGLFASLPTLNDEKADHQTFEKYAKELQASFADGFQWSDIAVIVRSSVEFVGGFHNLTTEEKQQSAVDIVNFVIDMTDTPFLPDMFIDPVFKAIAEPLVGIIFSLINS